MSYLVLARKSRPQKFSEVVGHKSVVKTLRNSVIRQRIAHAILFSGVRGVGKTTLARIMAKAINCQADLEERPCGNCDSCIEIGNGNHLDLYEIDGASNRGIQEIRELKEKIRFLPTSSAYKIIIIDEVHMLTTEAFNALLKTLEEPPSHVYFMFATTEIHKIPITILSRCQQYELKRIPAAELSSHFKTLVESEGFTIEPAALSLITREAAGSVRDGLSLLDQVFSYVEKTIATSDVVEILGLVSRDVLLRLSEGLLAGNRSVVFMTLEELFTFGVDTKRFMEDLMEYFRNLMLCKLDNCTELIDLPQEEIEDFHALAAGYSGETIHLKLNLLMACAEELRFSGQPRLLLETSFLKIIEASNVVPVSAILGQLDALLPNLPIQVENEQPVPLDSFSEIKKKQTIDASPSSEQSPPKAIDKALESIDQQPVIPENNEPTFKLPEETAIDPPESAPPPEAIEPPPEKKTSPIEPHPHIKDVRKHWMGFIDYVKDRKVWMAQDLQRADSFKEENDELHLSYSDPANCSVLRQKENRKLLTEYVLDFFQKDLKISFILPEEEKDVNGNGVDSPQKKRNQLANDPLVVMATEIFNGQVGDIRIGPRSR